MPVAFDFHLDVHLMNPQPVRDLAWVGGFGIEQAGVEVERVGQRMRRVHAHDESAIAQLREANTGRCRQTGLAYATFAAEKEDTHLRGAYAGFRSLPIPDWQSVQPGVLWKPFHYS